MDSANEISKGWILTERRLECVRCGLVLNVNRSKEMESAATKPVLAYQGTDAERSEVIRPPYAMVVVICVHTDVINDQKPKLCGKRLFGHVVRSSRSRRTIFGSEQWWCLKWNGCRL